MPLQTSFLIRCWFETSGGTTPLSYTVENTQTGDKLRSSDLSEVFLWIADVNHRLMGGRP